jgi:hypothetical protein
MVSYQMNIPVASYFRMYLCSFIPNPELDITAPCVSSGFREMVKMVVGNLEQRPVCCFYSPSLGL